VYVDAQVETRPKFETHVHMQNNDPYNVKIYNRASAGKVNKAVTVRS